MMAVATVAGLLAPRHPVTRHPQLAGRPGTSNCSTHYYKQPVDHFGPKPPCGHLAPADPA